VPLFLSHASHASATSGTEAVSPRTLEAELTE
jgi:hypothetical protein